MSENKKLLDYYLINFSYAFDWSENNRMFIHEAFPKLSIKWNVSKKKISYIKNSMFLLI